MTNVIYVGKSTGAVLHNQLFTTRPLALIAELEKKTPGIGAQFISVDEYAGVQLKQAETAKPAETVAPVSKVKGAKKNG